MNPYLLPVLNHGPKVAQRLIELIPESRWDEALEEGRFTPREVIAHLADWEPILLQRMQTAFESPGAEIQVFDEGEMAIEHDYANSIPQHQCELFEQYREITATWLMTIGEEDWNKWVLHPERGKMTILDQANMLLGHDLYHIEQLSAYLEQENSTNGG